MPDDDPNCDPDLDHIPDLTLNLTITPPPLTLTLNPYLVIVIGHPIIRYNYLLCVNALCVGLWEYIPPIHAHPNITLTLTLTLALALALTWGIRCNFALQLARSRHRSLPPSLNRMPADYALDACVCGNKHPPPLSGAFAKRKKTMASMYRCCETSFRAFLAANTRTLGQG